MLCYSYDNIIQLLYAGIIDAKESDIRGAFADHGSVTKIQMPLDRESVSILFLALYNFCSTIICVVWE